MIRNICQCRLVVRGFPCRAASLRGLASASQPAIDNDSVTIGNRDRANAVTKAGGKPLTNEPFVKNLFLGKFDTVSMF